MLPPTGHSLDASNWSNSLGPDGICEDEEDSDSPRKGSGHVLPKGKAAS